MKVYPAVTICRSGGNTEVCHYETRDDQGILIAQRSLDVLYNICIYQLVGKIYSSFLRHGFGGEDVCVEEGRL